MWHLDLLAFAFLLVIVRVQILEWMGEDQTDAFFSRYHRPVRQCPYTLTPEIIPCFDAAAMPYFSGCRPHYCRTFGLLLIEPFLLSFRAGERIRVAALARF